eukprot:351841-Chlamydomonas_euryale.AAC.6
MLQGAAAWAAGAWASGAERTLAGDGAVSPRCYGAQWITVWVLGGVGPCESLVATADQRRVGLSTDRPCSSRLS